MNHQNRVIIAHMFNDILAYKIAQRMGISTASSGQFLLPPRASITRRFRAHPARLTPLVAEQSIQKSRHSQLLAPARTAAASNPSHPAVPTPIFPASSQQSHNQTMILDSWSAIDSGDSVIGSRKIATVVRAIGTPRAQLRLRSPRSGRALVRQRSARGDQETFATPQTVLQGHTLTCCASTMMVPSSVWISRVR